MQDNIELRVLPTSIGPHCRVVWGFMVLHVRDAQSIDYVEIPAGAVYVQDHDQVAAYVRSAGQLISFALSEQESAEAIKSRLVD